MYLKKQMSLKPVIIIELFLVVILAGAGTALAFTSTGSISFTGNTSPIQGISYEQAISDSSCTVVSYDFTYDSDLDAVATVTPSLSGTEGDKYAVTVLIGDADFSPSQTKESTTQTMVASGSQPMAVVLTLDSAIATSDVTKIRFLVEKVNA